MPIPCMGQTTTGNGIPYKMELGVENTNSQQIPISRTRGKTSCKTEIIDFTAFPIEK